MESYLMNLGHRKALHKPAISLSLAAVISLGSVTALTLDAQAARRPGAARTLRLTGTDAQRPGLPWQSDSALDDSSLSQPVFGAQDGGKADLYFTRSNGATRNIWRTKMTIGLAPAKPSGGDDGERRPNASAMRDALLEAAPLTQLAAPYLASDAAPSPDGRWLLCTTNSGLSAANVAAGNSVIARLDPGSGKLTALTDGNSIDSAPVVSPDGTQFAYVSERGGFPAVYLQNLRGGEATLVSALARHPQWLDAGTLIFESTRPAKGGLYSVTVRADGPSNAISKPQFLWKRAGMAAASHNGRWLCVSTGASGGNRGAASTRLYLLAPDGSGARAINATDGARSLSFAPDDSAIVYDGPASENGKTTDKRTLWVLPMLRTLPSASLSEVRLPRGAKPASVGGIKPLDVYGTIYCEGGNARQIDLEWGEGDEPTQWRKLNVENEQANRGPLARWTPPATEGQWTFRLTVTDADGDSNQSLLTVALPLGGADQGSVPLFATQMPPAAPHLPAAIDTTGATPPVLAAAPPVAPVAAAPPPAVKAPAKPQPPANPRLVQRLPLPALPPAPDKEPAEERGKPALVVRAPESASDPAPQFVKPQAALAQATKPRPAARKPSSPLLAQAAKAKPAKKPKQRPAPTPATRPTPPSGKPAPSRRPGDAAVVTVTGVPMSMTVGQIAQLEATLRNTGSNGWKVSGDSPVRLLIYWRDLSTGRRTRWNIRWLRADVPPGGTTKLAFDLPAPARAGRFQLRFCLVRVEGGSYTPPPISETTMPGEFGVASTTMDVE